MEGEIRARHDAGDVDGATAAALRAYGAEVYGLLASLHASDGAADEVFSVFSERLWKSLSKFRWDCSMRTWAYRIARAASVDHRRSAGRRPDESPLSQSPQVAELAVRIRTETRAYLKTESKSELQRIRDELPEDERALLMLRIDRQMEWADLARIFLEERDKPVDDETLKRESARLRQRFKKVKDKVIALGRERGLIGREE